MTRLEITKVLFATAVDRIESVLPPCVTVEESVHETFFSLSVQQKSNADSYAWGVVECLSEALCRLYGTYMHDPLLACGFYPAIQEWIRQCRADGSTERMESDSFALKFHEANRQLIPDRD